MQQKIAAADRELEAAEQRYEDTTEPHYEAGGSRREPRGPIHRSMGLRPVRHQLKKPLSILNRS